jgi:lysophospholipase L1-like esterase
MKPRAPQSRPKVTPLIPISAAVIAIALIWMFRPAAKITNLNSRGTAIIAFGDSLTAGYGAAPGEDYPSRVSQRLGVPVVNAGVSGDTTESAAARLDADVLAQNPRLVIVGLGGNDFLRQVPIATTEASLRDIVRRIQSSGAMVVLLGFRFPSLNGDYEAMYKRVAHDEHCLLIPKTLAGILTDPKLKSDEIHPNARGYDLMADRVAAPLQKLLKSADGAR